MAFENDKREMFHGKPISEDMLESGVAKFLSDKPQRHLCLHISYVLDRGNFRLLRTAAEGSATSGYGSRSIGCSFTKNLKIYLSDEAPLVMCQDSQQVPRIASLHYQALKEGAYFPGLS